VVWVQLLPLWLPSHQVHVSLRLHFSSYSGRAQAEAGKAVEWDKQQRVWLRLEVRGKGHAHVRPWASPHHSQELVGKRICTEYGRVVWKGLEGQGQR